MALVPFLDRCLTPATVEPFLDARTVGGGPSVTGAEQVISIGAGIWRYAMSGISLRRPADIREFRRFVFAMDGRANTTLVPFFERARAPWPLDQWGRAITPAFARRGWIDRTAIDGLIGARFVGPVSSGQGIAAAQETAIVIEMLTTQANVAGQTLTLTPTLPQVGDLFSLQNRAHVVTERLAVNGLQASVRIRPPLRQAVAQGAPVNFSTPVCEMRFADDQQGRAALDQQRYASVALEFVEP